MDDMSAPGYRRDLGGGLVLRWSRQADAEGTASLCGYVFRKKADEPPNQWVMGWIRDMMSDRHPLIGSGDYAVVEESSSRRIVSGACLISYEIELEGMRIPFGRPEAVLTHPDYRNRGLVRAIFELLHARSAARGQLVQGITGIPYYYKLFGYEYAADLGGHLSVYFSTIPPLEGGRTEAYRLRRAAASELAEVKCLYDQDRARCALSACIDERYWSWMHSGQSTASGEGWVPWVVVDAEDAVAGYLLTGVARESDDITVCALGVRQGMDLSSVLPSVLRALPGVAGEVIRRKSDLPAPAKICFHLGGEHPVYTLLSGHQVAARTPPYAWYLRVADVPGFLLRTREILERRLAASPFAGHTGELRLTFHRGGLRMRFERGSLVAAEDWREDHAWGPRAQAGFPPGLFFALLFGYRSFAELRRAHPDVQVSDEAGALIDVLFPRRPSWLLALE